MTSGSVRVICSVGNVSEFPDLFFDSISRGFSSNDLILILLVSSKLSGSFTVSIVIEYPCQHCANAMRAIYDQNVSSLRGWPENQPRYYVTLRETLDELHYLFSVPIVGRSLKIWLSERMNPLFA